MKRFIIAAAAIALFSAQADAARVFLSSSNTDPTSAEPAVIDLRTGGTGEVFVWVTPDADQVINGLSLDIGIDTDTVSATDFAIDNPVAGLGSTRWNPGTNAGSPGAGPNLVDDASAVAVLEVGINEAFAQFDQGVVVNGDFLFGTLSLAATTLGDFNLSLGEGRLGAADTANGPFTPEFGGLALSVVGIPEPSTAILAALGLAGFVARRR